MSALKTTSTSPPHDPHQRNVGRGNACQACRDSKMRCDGVRPVCGRCMAARRRSINAMRKRGAVEADVRAVTFVPCFEGASAAGEPVPVKSERRRDEDDAEASSSSSSAQHKRRRRQRRHSVSDDSDEGSGGRIALPPYDALKEAVQVCYQRFRAMHLFHPARFMERIALPPNDERYPHAAALHAILALAYAACPALLGDDQSDNRIGPHTGTHYRHFLAAQRHIRRAFRASITPNISLDVARAGLLLVLKAYGQGDELDTFVYSAQSLRICVILNLHRDEEEDNQQQDGITVPMLDIANRSALRPVPADAIEAEEMRRTMLFAFSVDRTAAFATLWPSTISEEDYTAELPRASLAEYMRTTTANVGAQEWPTRYNANAIHSSTLLLRPAHDVSQFIVKNIVLYGRCAEFVSRLSRRATAEQIVGNERFQHLESWLAVLQLESQDVIQLVDKPVGSTKTLTLTSFMASPSTTTLDKLTVLTACMLPHICTLTLHEPIANLHEQSAAHCRAATHEVIQHLRLCARHAQDVLQLLDIPLTLCITIAGRSLIRQLERVYVAFIAQQISGSDGQSTTVNGDNNSDVRSPAAGVSAAAAAPQQPVIVNDLTDSVSHIQADLRVVLLTLKRMSEKWHVADKLHESLLTLLDFQPERRYRGIFFAGLLSSSSSSANQEGNGGMLPLA